MGPSGGRRVVGALCAALALASAGCGKKAPLRLPDSRPAEAAPSLRARVREGRVTLDFAVPSRRLFPEREEPWVLARILRQRGPGGARTEAGAILEANGFAFDAPLSWTDEPQPPGGAWTYQVEFRDAARRRRAQTGALAVAWESVPEAPTGLTAAGAERAVALSWDVPSPGAVRYRVYRRSASGPEELPASADPIAGGGFTDTRVEAGRAYCYRVRAVVDAQGVEVEGAASPEACVQTVGPPAPPREPPALP